MHCRENFYAARARRPLSFLLRAIREAELRGQHSCRLHALDRRLSTDRFKKNALSAMAWASRKSRYRKGFEYWRAPASLATKSDVAVSASMLTRRGDRFENLDAMRPRDTSLNLNAPDELRRPSEACSCPYLFRLTVTRVNRGGARHKRCSFSYK
jgi:hypothetical protein